MNNRDYLLHSATSDRKTRLYSGVASVVALLLTAAFAFMTREESGDISRNTITALECKGQRGMYIRSQWFEAGTNWARQGKTWVAYSSTGQAIWTMPEPQGAHCAVRGR